jgi:ketosteroid isomerase-like protein
MADGTEATRLQVLEAFADAFNRHDIHAIMALMTKDCIFEASAGPEVCGARFVGSEAVGAAFIEVWTTFPNAQWQGARHYVFGDRGLSEWTFSGTRADGSRVEVNGCDLLTFHGNQIAIKNSYRKNRPPITTAS